jgi:hypothetical protein
MVYKYHQKWRDNTGLNSGIFDICYLSPEQKKIVHNMQKSKPIIPYTLEICCNSYWGNFEREFIAYSLGILDDVQMDIRHSEEELEMFWKEVFNKEAPDFEEALESYELLKDYLLETFQDVDDWWQLTFYQIDWEVLHREKRNVLKIQLAKPLSTEWEEIIIPRMKKFFDKKIYEHMDKDAELEYIYLYDRKGVVKEY